MGTYPGSLSEGAGSPIGLTEGVSFDGSTGPVVYPQAIIGSEIFELIRSSKYTPSVSHSLDSSLREGAGNGCGGFCHSTGYLLNQKVAGDFHRPYGGRVGFIVLLKSPRFLTQKRYRVGQGTGVSVEAQSVTKKTLRR